VVAPDGTVYVAVRQTLTAYRESGRRKWRDHIAPGPVSLALRADGILLVASRRNLQAVSPAGKERWRLQLTEAKGGEHAVTVIVDEPGRAYVGTSDGKVRVVSTRGKVLATLHVGPPAAWSPPLALGPDGQLAVTGTDGTLRVYD
jgi:hypothetical protein